MTASPDPTTPSSGPASADDAEPDAVGPAAPSPEAVDVGLPADDAATPIAGAPMGTRPLPVPSLELPEDVAEEAGDATRRHLRTRRMSAAAVAAAIVVTVVVLVTSLVATSAGGPHGPSAAAATSGSQANRADGFAHRVARLPAATSTPEPAPPSLADSAPLQSHEVFGYAPYWTLPQSSGFDVADLTTLAYFSVDANADGSLDESGAGWNGYQSQDLVDLVNRSHAAGDRVVLTITCFDQQTLNAITSDPSAPARLSAALVSAIEAKNLDGVNFDFEGEGSADQAGLTNLITKVSATLHATDPHWQVTMAVYASAAGDPNGFYDIADIAPAVDGFFVMAYDMNSKTQPSPTSPLFGGNFSDSEAIEQFLKVVPASKIILGLPYYGYDWPTANGSAGAAATGPETPLSYATIAAAGHPTYWDPTTDTPWTSYQVGTQWHTTYYDDPTSLALKAQLAGFFHIAGVGIWALGMDGNDPAMLSALLGNAPVVKDSLTGPPPGSGYLTFATFAGTPNVALAPITSPPPGGTSQLIGFLGGIGTTDPALACLSTGAPLPVWSFTTMPGVYVVIATAPTDCAAAMFTFPVPPPAAAPAAAPAPAPTTTRPPPPTTTTTRPPPPTTTTTTTRPPATTTTTTTTTTTAP